MAAEDRPIFTFPDIAYAGLSGDFYASQDGPKPERPHQLGFMIMHAARHGGIVEVPVRDRDNTRSVEVSHPVPWAENVVTRVVADLHGSVGLIRHATLTADNGSELSVIVAPRMVTVGLQSFALEDGTIRTTQQAVAQAARGFFVEAASQQAAISESDVRAAEPA